MQGEVSVAYLIMYAFMKSKAQTLVLTDSRANEACLYSEHQKEARIQNDIRACMPGQVVGAVKAA